MPEDAAPDADPPSDARTWATAGHLSGLVWLVGAPGPLGPLVVWLLKRHEHGFVEDQAREALNFQLSLLAYGLVLALAVGLLALTGSPGVGFAGAVPTAVLAAALVLFGLAFTIVAAYRSSEGERYRYPLTVRWIG